MTGRRGPAQPDSMPPPNITAKQGETLILLVTASLNYPGEIVPTRHPGLNMGTVRSLASKGLLDWRTPPRHGGQGVRLTTDGYYFAQEIRAAQEAAEDARA